MYAPTDPRSGLASAAPKPPSDKYGDVTYARFYEAPPQLVGPRQKSWLARGESFLTRYSETEAGASLAREDQPDEYAVLVPGSDTEVDIAWGDTEVRVPGNSLVFVPPGPSRIHVLAGGTVVSLFTTRAADLVALCVNGDGYRSDPNVPPLQGWPAPRDGWKIRSYSLDVPAEKGRFGRIFRSTTLMINCLDVRDGPRDPTGLSPHDHDDFQQGSLALEGDFIHHLRWPWGPDATRWRPDEHEHCGSPSIVYIPARVLHTSQAVGTGRNVLCDIFSPPRMDFSLKPGWVLNAADYPDLPEP